MLVPQPRNQWYVSVFRIMIQDLALHGRYKRTAGTNKQSANTGTAQD